MENRIGEARRDYADRVGGFTQKDAADCFGVSLSTYKKWEQGQGKLNGGILREISDKYGVTVDYLLGIVRKTSVNKAANLSPDEKRLVDLYRSMSAEYRDMLMKSAVAYVTMTEKSGAGNRRDVAEAGELVSA